MISSNQIRRLFLEYCEEKGYEIAPSSPLPTSTEDKSLLFVNAGMVPFKPFFAGKARAEQTNLASIQRCLRAGGKHNDLENVGYTARHHTFFEMLGNFSFGGHTKEEAILFAFAFLTDVLKIPKAKLWVTVYEEDKETAQIWLEQIKIDSKHLSYCGRKDNFWMMGETGPCGPCTEIFYDHGPSVQGKPPGSKEVEGDRYVEIWNLVFMQYDQRADGELVSLPKPCIDTGMGLERLAAVMQGVTSNYETDLFKPLLKAAAQLMPSSSVPAHTLKVIADHMRAITFLIMDGITPSNEGRGYVLRRIIRRAVRHGYQVGLRAPFLHQLVQAVVKEMATSYPELVTAEASIQSVLFKEEEKFLHTLDHGIQYFEKAVLSLEGKVLTGQVVFKLYDTYGFPVDLTADLLRERKMSWDEAGFEKEMQNQKQRSKAGKAFSNMNWDLEISSVFKGDAKLQHQSQVTGLLNEKYEPVKELSEKGYVILDQTPFYAEAGGQVGDQGELRIEKEGEVMLRFIVLDTQKINTAYLHRGYLVKGVLRLEDVVHSQVNGKRRQNIRCHHSATHLLQAALREILGPEATQKGSLVHPDYLRFDFQYQKPLIEEHVQQVEDRVNQAIRANLAVQAQLMPLEVAKKMGAIALFSEKYTHTVRVLRMGNFSIELCGGTHVNHTGEIGYFKTRSFRAIAAGIKRIEAVAGEPAIAWVRQLEIRQTELIRQLRTSPDRIVHQVAKQMEVNKQQAVALKQLKSELCIHVVHHLSKGAVFFKESTLVLGDIPLTLRQEAQLMVEQLKAMHSSQVVIILGCQLADHLLMSVGVSKSYAHAIDSRAIIAALNKVMPGKGGGRPDFAQMTVSWSNQAWVPLALETVKRFLRKD